MAPLAYVVLDFPKLSETFIVDELLALDNLGVRPLIFARQKPSEGVSNRRAQPLLARATWLSDRSRLAQLRAVLVMTARHPARMVQCLVIAVRTKSRWPLLNLWYSCTLAELVQQHGVQFLHAHFAGDAGELAYFASRLTGAHYGLTVHATDIYWNRFLCPKLREADLLVTVCQYNIGQMVERCPDVTPDSIRIKYAGVDAEHFQLPRPRPLRPGRQVIAVGRLHTKKGFDQLITAMATLRDEGRDIECTIVGEGEEEPKLRALIAQHALEGVVHLAGARRPDEILELLVDADVLAAPCTLAASGNRDSMPVVIKEAMAMELPVVATDDFGIPEMVTPEVGVLVPRDDPAALAVALADVLARSPEERAEMGRAGRARVLAHFHEPALVPALADAFDTVMTRTARSRGTEGRDSRKLPNSSA